jgi:hypothetical protein
MTDTKNETLDNNIKSNNMLSKNDIFIQMINLQRKNLSYKYRLNIDDIHRILNNISTSPFAPIDCCIWNGYVTLLEKSKIKYINFYFKHRKIAIHRLLYINYVDDLNDDSYLKFTCENKGICCNVNHIIKRSQPIVKSNNKNNIPINNLDNEKTISPTKNKKNKKNKLTIIFD